MELWLTKKESCVIHSGFDVFYIDSSDRYSQNVEIQLNVPVNYEMNDPCWLNGGQTVSGWSYICCNYD